MRTFPILRHLRSVPPSLLKASPKGEGVHPSQSGTLSNTLNGECVGLEEIDDAIYSIYLGHVLLARFDWREWKIYP